jgi:hypothetical protein
MKHILVLAISSLSLSGLSFTTNPAVETKKVISGHTDRVVAFLSVGESLRLPM